MNRIVYDNIVFSLQKFGGISTYWFELTKRLIADPHFNSSFLHYHSNNLFKDSLNELVSLENRNDIPLLIERFLNPSLKSSQNPFIFHSSYHRISTNPNAKNITTIHDLIHHKYYGGPRSLMHNYQKKKAILNSSAIIAVSKNTKKDLLEIYPDLQPDKVSVIYNGVSSDYHVIDQSSHNYEVPYEILHNKFIVCVSSREPYKNFPFAVDVIAKMQDCKLYIVGPPLKKAEAEFLNNRIGGRWRSFTSISNGKLNELFNHALGMIFPSSYEGFGIPIIEAMKAGCPSVTLNTSSIPEVAGKAAIMIDELNIDEFLKGFELLINNRNHYVAKGLLHASKFSWDKCYKETSNLYCKILNEG